MSDRAHRVLATLHAWAERGVLRRLDSALAQWVCALHPGGDAPLAWAAACVSAHEGRGHTAVPLSVLADPAGSWLRLPPGMAEAAHRSWWADSNLGASWPRSEVDWLDHLMHSPAVAVWDRAAAVPSTVAPLVLVRPDGHGPAVLQLMRHARAEREVALALQRLAATPHPFDADVARATVQRLFPQLRAEAGLEPDWQATACALALRSGLTVITGGPGTGKTFTTARLLALLQAQPGAGPTLRVALAAPTGKAAARLRQSLVDGLSGLVDADWLKRLPPAQTLHRLLGARPDSRKFRHHAAHPLDLDVLVVDEASMVHLDLMAALLAALPATARLVLLGDADQLASVEAGSVMGDLCPPAPLDEPPPCPDADTQRQVAQLTGQHWPRVQPAECRNHSAASAVQRQTVSLRHSRRFAGGIGQLARAVQSGDPSRVRAVWAARPDDLARVTDGQPDRTAPGVGPSATSAGLALEALAVRAWGTGYLQRLHPEGDWADWAHAVLKAWDAFRVLCAVHDGDWGTQALNRRVQRALVQAGHLTVTGEWFAGRPVMVTRNDPALGLSNGDIGLVLPVPPSPSSAAGSGRLKACFADGTSIRAIPVGRLAHVETAFALSVHKSQGSEFGHVALVLPPSGQGQPSRELVYTGITRARERFTLLEAQPGLLEMAVAEPTRRHSGLRGWLSAWPQG